MMESLRSVVLNGQNALFDVRYSHFQSFFSLIWLDARGQRRHSCETTIQKLGLIPS